MPQAESDPRLARSIALINAKGGVLKTSTTANLAGQFALGDDGYKVLAIELDITGNLGLDLGYARTDRDDQGMSLVMALAEDTDIPVINVRPNLDVIPGGPKLAMLRSLRDMPDVQDRGGLPGLFAQKLAELVERNGYEIQLIDSAPGNFDPTLQDMALAAARYVLIPTHTDDGSIDGVRGVGPKVRNARQTGNPDIEYLGLLITSNQTAATNVLRVTREFLGKAFDGKIPVFKSRIRHTETMARDCRARGQLAHEIAEEAAAQRKTRLLALRARDDASVPLPPQLSGTSQSLADDYRRLAHEVLMRIAEIESTTPIAKGL